MMMTSVIIRVMSHEKLRLDCAISAVTVVAVVTTNFVKIVRSASSAVTVVVVVSSNA